LTKTEQTPDPFDRDAHCLLGLPFDALDEADALSVLRESIRTRQRCFLSTPNMNWIVACLQDVELRNSVIDSNLSVPDGMPIIWIARMLRIPLRQRVAGSELMEKLRADQTQRTSVYFFGGPEGVAEQACRQLNFVNGPMRCVGFECPGFGDVASMSSNETIKRINNSGADFLVVALGASKGQAWIQRNRNLLDVPVISHLGAVVNFIAGTVERAPSWMQRTGLEWLWRIHQEPALWRRYFSDGLVFLRLLVTRVAPLAFHIRLSGSPTSGCNASVVACEVKGHQSEVMLSGNWKQADLASLRKCFREVSRVGLDVCLNMNAVTEIDSAFVGLLMLLDGQCRRQSTALKITGINGGVKRQLHYCCAVTLLKNN